MRITVQSGRLEKSKTELVVVPALQDEEKFERLLSSSLKSDRALIGLMEKAGFRGSLNETVLIPKGSQWFLGVGLGKSKDLSLDRMRQLAGTAAKAARARGFRSLALAVLSQAQLGAAGEVAQALAEGVLLSLYRYDQLKEVPKYEKNRRVEAVVLVVERSSEVASAKKAVEKAQVITEAVALARDLINGPSNFVTPTYLADTARRIGRQNRLHCQVIPFAELKRRGFGGIVGVAQGSNHPAQFIVLDYRPARAKATFAFCGKGITFDSGGISLKPSAKMEQMKYDMSGAAAVLGVVQASARLKLPVRIVGIIAATENLPSGTAQKPGDVLKTLSGKTVEVINTDAEGRLVLSDCLHYAKRYKPDCVVDLATLTGACVVALGSEAIGLMTQSDRLANRLTAAGEKTHERLWRLPLWDEYKEMLKSDVADLKNVTDTGQAGTITAAKFLEEFAGDLPWAHLDIAGTAWADREKPYIPKGAVGIGVRLLIRLMEEWVKQ
ncbi:MAG: leucyl aminopeptidase [Candidatus Omnitrophica bacterium]|nr:leucyl aminopeptidase [Candidatus Omnitrophota bacterium]MBI2173800.1 leucyl aminopeptidase [Candidatus Omnitrophota bacterium]MBI3010426.1 leucyl aminopeptidase [Candidatus Omnitrophota bacterium]